MTAMRVVLAVLGLAALVAACSDRTSGESGSPAASPSGSASAASGAPSSSLDPTVAALVQPVVADAAARLGVDPAAVVLVSIDAVTWNDGSLGCPKPGEMYTQALVPGYRIVLEAGGRELDYHASESGTIKLCEGVPGS